MPSPLRAVFVLSLTIAAIGCAAPPAEVDSGGRRDVQSNIRGCGNVCTAGQYCAERYTGGGPMCMSPSCLGTAQPSECVDAPSQCGAEPTCACLVRQVCGMGCGLSSGECDQVGSELRVRCYSC